MKWNGGTCQITDAFYAHVRFDIFRKGWIASIRTDCEEDYPVWATDCLGSEDAAKSAVAAWIGKTIAQLGNALAAGEPRIDEE